MPCTFGGSARCAAGSAWAIRRPAWRVASFCGGLLVLLFALNGPMHDLSDYYLFSAHMAQHLLLTLVLPPLLIAGTPGWLLQPLLRIRRCAPPPGCSPSRWSPP